MARMTSVLLACVLVAAACSGGDGEAQPTTVAPVTTAGTTTTAPATAAPPTTAAAPSTLPATTAPPTTVPPTTAPSTAAPSTLPVLDPIGGLTGEERAMVERDLAESFKAFEAALVNPDDPSAVERASAYYTDSELGVVEGTIQRFNAEGLRLRPNPTSELIVFIEQGPARVEGTADEVLSIVCEIDPRSIVRLETDGTEVVDAADLGVRRAEVHQRLDAGVWKQSEYRLVRQWYGEPTCPDL